MSRPLKYTILIAAVILSGILVIIFSRSRILNMVEIDKSKFICTYSDLSIAKEQFPAGSDSLRLKFEEIYRAYGTDSSWMEEFIQKYSNDLSTKTGLWNKIVNRLDSLRLATNKISN